MEKKKICFPMPRFEMGGLERVQMYIAKGLLHSEYQVDLVIPVVAEDVRTLIETDVNIHETSCGKFKFLFNLINYIKKYKPDVIITSANDIGCLILFCRKIFCLRTKIIWTQHLSISGPLKVEKGLIKYKLLFEIWLMKQLIKQADSIVAVSNTVANDMKNMLRSDLDIQVIYNPVISSDFEEKINETVVWPWEEWTCQTIIFVGRLAKVKRLDLLLNAFAECRKQIPIRLLVVGSGPEEKSARILAENLNLGDSCKFLGHQDNPAAWISKSDLLVLCSDVEGFGLVLVEAMACGIQVLSTDCPDGPAEILDNGHFGRIIPMNNVKALALGVIECIQDPLLSEAQLKAYAEKFTVENAVAQYQALLCELKTQDDY